MKRRVLAVYRCGICISGGPQSRGLSVVTDVVRFPVPEDRLADACGNLTTKTPSPV